MGADDLTNTFDTQIFDKRDLTPDFITKVHSKAYPAINPTQPSLSAAGKTILVTGGATGIGFEIARSFAAAGATTVVLVARRPETLETASASISKEFPSTQVLSFPTDIANIESVKKLFDSTVKEAKNKSIDVLITSAVYTHKQNAALDIPVDEIRASLETNVIGNLELVRNFIAAPSSSQKIILDVATNGFLNVFPTTSVYGGSKSAFTFILRHIQVEHPEIRVHSFHPGAVWTPNASSFGFPKELVEPILDEVDLPGHFAVWLASPQAEFAKGRFLFSKWDVEDLVKNKEAFEKDARFSVVTLKL